LKSQQLSITNLGDLLVLGSRKYRYCANSTTALTAAKMTTGPTVVAHHINCASATASVVGDNHAHITLGATAATENQYSGGYIWANAGTAIGSCYFVKGHAAIALSTAGVINLWDSVHTLTATNTKWSLYPNPYKSVVIYPATTATNKPTGVPAITVTASTSTVTYYFWAQTGGPVSMYMGATYTIGSGLGIDNLAGMGLTTAHDTSFCWGAVIQIGSTTDSPSLVWLMID
jgi:hypothetical protein